MNAPDGTGNGTGRHAGLAGSRPVVLLRDRPQPTDAGTPAMSAHPYAPGAPGVARRRAPHLGRLCGETCFPLRIRDAGVGPVRVVPDLAGRAVSRARLDVESLTDGDGALRGWCVPSCGCTQEVSAAGAVYVTDCPACEPAGGGSPAPGVGVSR